MPVKGVSCLIILAVMAASAALGAIFADRDLHALRCKGLAEVGAFLDSREAFGGPHGECIAKAGGEDGACYVTEGSGKRSGDIDEGQLKSV